jgi:hypothetical protein
MLNLMGLGKTAGTIMPQKQSEDVEIKDRKRCREECLLKSKDSFKYFRCVFAGLADRG